MSEENIPPKIGQVVPHFSAMATDKRVIEPGALRGKNYVLYFYPKDGTPGCTMEGRDFCDKIADFERANTAIYGVSRDTMEAHLKFKEKQCFSFELISDRDDALCTLFDVLKVKSFLGKKIRGIERSTFLVDAQGVLRCEWRNVAVRGHAKEVLEAAERLQG